LCDRRWLNHRGLHVYGKAVENGLAVEDLLVEEIVVEQWLFVQVV
jgi:hypothetical protein